MRPGFTSFLSTRIVPALVVGAGTFLLSCSMTKETLRNEKTTTEPVVISGPVKWNETVDIRALPADEPLTEDGAGVFEILAAENPSLGPVKSGSVPDWAKVKFHYKVKYAPKKEICLMIDSASVETKKEITTITESTKVTVEKKIYRILFFVCIGIILTLTAILSLKRFL